MRDAELIAALPLLAQHDNELMADLLAHLAELDERKLYLDLGFRSIWEYCTLGLGFCETTAWRRYTAARVCRRFPQVFEMVARGELQLSVLAALAKHLTVENAKGLFEACGGKSIRRVEELIAARFPVPDIRDSIRRLPERGRVENRVGAATPSEPAGTSGAGCDLLARPQTLDCGSGQKVSEVVAIGVAAVAPPPPPPATLLRVEPLSADRFGIRFTADAEFLELLEQVRDLAGHRHVSGDLLSTMKAALSAYRGQLLKERFAVGRKPRGATETTIALEATSKPSSRELTRMPANQRRAPTAAVARAVYERDAGQCTYVASDGRRCSGRRLLELDHVVPHAVGGADTPDNMRLRCRGHNQQYARQYFGRSYMSLVVKRVRAQRVNSS